MKGKKGKIALAAAAVAALAGVAALFKGCGDDKKSEGIVAPSPAPAPVIPEEQTQPVESRYDVLHSEIARQKLIQSKQATIRQQLLKQLTA